MRHVPLRAVVGVAMACVAASAAPAAGPEAPAADPWNGKPRAEVVELLGEPNKAKTAKDGRETLTYMFDRIAPDAPPHPEVMLLHVPGIGVVARVARGGAPDAIEMEPTVYDKEGRPAGGGPTRTNRASTSVDAKTGEVTQSPSSQEMPRLLGKVKLRLVLGAERRVESWSVTGKE